MKNVWITLCAVSIMLCSGPVAAADAIQPMIIRLNWIPNVQFAGVLVAQERGWYAEAGIDLTIKGWEEGSISTEEVVSGKADIGVAEGDAIIKARVAGQNVKAIATAFQKTAFCLMSKKELGIETPEQLRGTRIGYSSHESLLMISLILASAGLNENDVTTVQVGWDLDPLVNDEIDVREAFMNEEPLVMKDLGYDVNIIPAFKHGYDFYSGVYVVTETMLAEQPELIQAFLDVTLRGWKAAFNDPAATAQVVVEQYFPDGSVQQQTESLKLFRMLATLGEGKKFLGMMQARIWTKGIESLYEFQHIEQKIPAEDIFTVELLEKIYFHK